MNDYDQPLRDVQHGITSIEEEEPSIVLVVAIVAVVGGLS